MTESIPLADDRYPLFIRIGFFHTSPRIKPSSLFLLTAILIFSINSSVNSSATSNLKPSIPRLNHKSITPPTPAI